MSSADKAKLDSMSSTYATKAELSEYLRCIEVESGYNLVNSDGDVIFSITLEDPQLSVNPSEVTLIGGTTASVEVTRLGNGAITVLASTEESGTFTATVSDTVITLNTDMKSGSGTLTVNVAQTNDYKSATAVVPVTFATKKDPQLTITPSTSAVTGREARASATISYLGNGTLSVISKETSTASFDEGGYNIQIDNNVIYMGSYGGLASSGSESIIVTVALSETDEYTSTTAIWTITGIEPS